MAQNTSVIDLPRHRLDLAARRLTDAQGRDVALRPQAMELLCRLAGRPNVLHTKDELLAAVWPSVVVGDDSLVQAVGDVRRALGDGAHRLIVTVNKRGYRLELASRAVTPREAEDGAGAGEDAGADAGVQPRPDSASARTAEPAAPPAPTPLAAAALHAVPACAANDAAAEPDGAARARPVPGRVAALAARLRGGRRPRAHAVLLGAAWAVLAAAGVWALHAGLRAAPEHALVVLPLGTHAADAAATPEVRQVARELTEELTTALADGGGWRVVALPVVLTVAEPASAAAAPEAMGARYAIEGSVRQAAGRLRITARLADRHAHRVLWAQQLDAADDHSPEAYRQRDAFVQQAVRAVRSRMPLEGGGALAVAGR